MKKVTKNMGYFLTFSFKKSPRKIRTILLSQGCKERIFANQ